MTIFNFISLFGGLALFLYGMQLMGDGLKKGSSGALKAAMEKVTNNPLVGFLLGLAVTAVIQSSTATIVLTSGLVGAGVLTLHQSIGIILGANVGTTITGQIIRLLDLNARRRRVAQSVQALHARAPRRHRGHPLHHGHQDAAQRHRRQHHDGLRHPLYRPSEHDRSGQPTG